MFLVLKNPSFKYRYMVIISTFSHFSVLQESLQDTTRYNEKVLDSIILEVQRLWPPFVGGRRLVRQVRSYLPYFLLWIFRYLYYLSSALKIFAYLIFFSMYLIFICIRGDFNEIWKASFSFVMLLTEFLVKISYHVL